jgi:large subunit ribosomal protein L30
VIIENNKSNIGTLKKINDFITYGEIDEKVLSKLKEKKAPISESESKLVYALPNPVKGFRAVKRGYNEGGDLGYRGKDINELMERIIENI